VHAMEQYHSCQVNSRHASAMTLGCVSRALRFSTCRILVRFGCHQQTGSKESLKLGNYENIVQEDGRGRDMGNGYARASTNARV
jgi:hypothetical protein